MWQSRNRRGNKLVLVAAVVGCTAAVTGGVGQYLQPRLRNSGKIRAGFVSLSGKALTRSAMRMLWFDVHTDVWLHSMVLHGRDNTVDCFA